jgi:hypothetical protein
VVFIVAISLLFLIGMLALVFDLGRIIAVRRDLVNGADAGALAAARECALGNGSTAAKAAAELLVADNMADAGLTTDLPDGPTWNPADGFWSQECDVLRSGGSKLVRVQGTVTLEYFFAQIFGFRSGPVTKAAVAQWGPARGVTSPVPIYLGAANLAPCISDPNPAEPVDCTFVFDNTPVSSQFGWLNFPEGWNASSCNAQGGANDIAEYVDPDPLPPGLAFDAEIPTPPGYVYACGSPGEIASTVVNAFQERLNSSDPYLTFPVTDFAKYPPQQLGGNTYRFAIVGFTKLRVVAAVKGKDVEKDPYCRAKIPPGSKVNNSWFCVHLQFDGTKIEGIPGTGVSYGLEAVRLVD